jgi:pyrophosphatase PpaX
MSSIQAIIFDMDGTLIDSREIVLGAFRHVLEEVGQPYDEVNVKSYVGRLLDHTYQALLPGYDPKELADLHRSWQADNRHLLKGFEGLDGFLGLLKKRGLKLGVFTSAIRTRTDLALDGLGIRKYFDAIVCGDEVIHPKPHQEGIETLARLMDVQLHEIVMVGDAEHDILSGKSAGVITIGITHGFGTRAALTKAGANYLVSNLKELLKAIEKLMLDNPRL